MVDPEAPGNFGPQARILSGLDAVSNSNAASLAPRDRRDYNELQTRRPGAGALTIGEEPFMKTEASLPSNPMVFVAGAACALVGMVLLTSGCSRNVPEERSPVVPESITGSAGRIHVDDGGTGGTPVVFVHSFAGSGSHWSAQLAHLRPTRRAIALDLRGHGQSDAPGSMAAYAVDSLATDIAAVVNGLGLERVVLVGHSMGGSAAIAFAGANPDRVDGLVLVGTPGKSPPEQAQKIMASMEADYEKVSEGYWKSLLTDAQPNVETQIRDDMKRVPREPAMAMIAAVFAYDPLPALQAYPGPKLLVDTVHGESPGSLHKLAPEIPRQVIAGTSHWAHMDKAEEFNRLLDQFLVTVESGSASPRAQR